MNWNTKKSGFAMLEVIVAGMIFMILVSSLYTFIRAEQGRVQDRTARDEAYYAAVSAVRLMEQEVVDGTYEEGSAAFELTDGDGMKKRKTKLIFEPEECDSEPVEVWVTIWSEREEDELLLAAEAEVRGKTETVALRLVKNEEISEEVGNWEPVSYDFGISD